MRYEKKNGTTHIYVENEETEQQVLRAIVKASFELACSALVSAGCTSMRSSR